jgi:1,4-dihydroxy-6-naphthoate synthase
MAHVSAPRRLRVGISTCPNDTFAFHGLLSGAIRSAEVEFALELHDVQTLNELFRRGELDVAKVSFAALLDRSESTWVLPVGAALGFGVGPVVLRSPWPDAAPLVLAPGEHTTANLLWRIFHPGEGEPRQVVFSQIMPALARGEARFGVCIHEGRFTYRDHGLEFADDLGQRWETATGLPLPLGGLALRRELGAEVAAALSEAVGRSLDYARENRASALESMRRHAQEHSDDVLWQHVELYVSDETRHMSSTGRAALAELGVRAALAGLAPAGRPALELAPG